MRRLIYVGLVIAALSALLVVVRARQERMKAEVHAAVLEQALTVVLKGIEQRRADAGSPIKTAPGDFDTKWSLRNGDKPPPNSN